VDCSTGPLPGRHVNVTSAWIGFCGDLIESRRPDSDQSSRIKRSSAGLDNYGTVVRSWIERCENEGEDPIRVRISEGFCLVSQSLCANQAS